MIDVSKRKGGRTASKIKAKKRSRSEVVCENLGSHLEQNDSMPQLLPKEASRILQPRRLPLTRTIGAQAIAY